MTKTAIPIDAFGYKVDVPGKLIHTRYANHGEGVRTRTVKGVQTLLGDGGGKPCKDCYPAPRYASDTPRSPQKRRSGKTWRQAAIEANAQVNAGDHPLLEP